MQCGNINVVRCSYFHVFIFLTNIALVCNDRVEEEKNVSNGKENTIFADVIKNISRVNHVLQELIKNYEHLEKIYKTRSFETDVSSDSEIDELFKVNSKKGEKRTKNNETRKEIFYTTKKSYLATEMIFSEEKSNKGDDDDDDNYQSISKDGSSQSTEVFQVPNVNSTEIENIFPVSTGSEKTDSSLETKEAKHKGHKHSDEIKVPDNVFFDNVNKNKSATIKSGQMRSKKPKIKKIKLEPVESNDEKTDNNVISSTIFNDTNKKNVKHIIRLEAFKKDKIWSDIAHKKPIKLRAINATSFELKNHDKNYNRTRFLRSNSRMKKPALVIIAKRKVTETNEDKSILSDASDLALDEEIHKDLIQTNILREAYGDACLKTVLKKCLKALAKVGKTVCRMIKCRSMQKELFKENTKTGCLAQFRPNVIYNNGGNLHPPGGYPPGGYRPGGNPPGGNPPGGYPPGGNPPGGYPPNGIPPETDPLDVDASDDDILRGGTLPLESCYPFMMQPRTNINLTAPGNNIKLNILRDSYERECQRSSASRCYTACKYAYITTCNSSDCERRKLKAFKKECKRQCKSAYIVRKDLKHSSDSDSDDTDSSGSFDISLGVGTKL